MATLKMLDVFLPMLLAFLFALLLKKVACKKQVFFVVYWIVLGMYPALILARIIQILVLYPNLSELIFDGLEMLFVYGIGVLSGWFINPQKWKHWLLWLGVILLTCIVLYLIEYEPVYVGYLE